MIATAVAWAGWMLAAGGGCSSRGDAEGEVRWLRLRGELEQARALAESELACERSTDEARIRLHLELARIHDRWGLHRNQRPVAEVLRQAERAATLARSAGPALRGQIELTRAMHHYRRGDDDGLETSARHAREALRLFETAGDGHGKANAVHQLGLIHLMRRELETAREHFDRSLRLDEKAGGRDVFRGDYERHVGLVHGFGGDSSASLASLERSLRYRQRAGALDASLFAAETLGSAFVDARRAYEMALDAARRVSYTSAERTAADALTRLPATEPARPVGNQP